MEVLLHFSTFVSVFLRFAGLAIGFSKRVLGITDGFADGFDHGLGHNSGMIESSLRRPDPEALP